MKTLPALFAAATLVASAASCRVRSTGLEESDDGTIGVSHVVICWLKEPGNPDHRRRLIDATRRLEEIPGVLEVTAGPVLPSQRPVVDSGYDVGIIIRFRDEQALRNYDQHPIHRAAVQNTLMPLVDRFVVYDFTTQLHQWEGVGGDPSRPAGFLKR